MSGLQFLAPYALLALPPLAGAVVILYLLKLRRRDFVVPSTFLWQRATQDMEANTPFQRLRKNLLMFLQLAALAAVVCALASPFIMSRRLGGQSVVLILDASASMNATDVSPTRLEQARRQAGQIVNDLGRRDEAALVVCAPRARVAVPFTSDRRVLSAGLGSVTPTDCPTDMGEAVLLALSLASQRQHAQIYVISDGAFAPVPAAQSSAEIHFVRVGAGNDNMAILAFEVSRTPGEEGLEAFTRVRNYSAQARSCALSVYREEQLLDARRLDLKPGENRVETFRLPATEAGLLRAELDIKDALQADNVAYAFTQARAQTSVLLVTPGNLFLEQGLLAVGAEAHKATSLSAEEAPKAYEGYDVVIFDRVAPPAVPRTGGFLLIATDGWGEPATLGAAVQAPAVTRWDQQHPLLRYVNLAAVRISKARALQPSQDTVTLAEMADAPVVVALDRPGLRAASFGWDLLDSDLPLRVGFPVLLSNCLQWLSQAHGAGLQRVTRPGQALSFPAVPEAAVAEATLPGGERRSITATAGRYVIDSNDRVGAYTLQAGGRKWRWAVDLRDARESDIAPTDSFSIGARTVQAGTQPPRVEQHFWPWLALAALVILLGEWHLYHRRY